MLSQKIALLFGCFSLLGISPALAESCQRNVVVSPEGYTNVRSSPRVQKDNIIGTLFSGTSLDRVRSRSGWTKIRSPLSGWIHSSQVSALSCTAASALLRDKGLPTLERLAKQSIEGDRDSAEGFLRGARGLDGITAETYTGFLTDWANRNPSFLVSVLQKQSPVIRQAVLETLNIGLGSSESPDRLRFAGFLKTLPANNLIVLEWNQLNRS